VALRVDPGLAALFGSEDRVRTLAALANAEAPLTAYRVASMVQMKPPNVYRELKRLLEVDEVKRATTPDGQSGWTLVDLNVRALLQRRQRIVWSQDLSRGMEARERRAAWAIQQSRQRPIDLSKFEPGRPLTAEEIRQRRLKDKTLARAGARRSVRLAKGAQ
jgi:hypothetical protein